MHTVQLDFGHSSMQTKGYFKSEAVYTTSKYIWITPTVYQWSRSETIPHPFRDRICTQGDARAELRIGLPAGTYEIELLFWNPDTRHPGFRVQLGAADARAPLGTETPYLTRDVLPDQSAAVALRSTVLHDGRALCVSLLNGGFINAMRITGSGNFQLYPLYEEAIDFEAFPPADQMPGLPRVSPLEALESACEWLLKRKDRDGFIGESDHLRYWYTASYPIRTLLAGWEFLKKPQYYETAIRLTDEFIMEQMPEGAYPQRYLGRNPAGMTESELEEIRSTMWMNLADVSSMVIAVLVACHYTDGERRARYLQSVHKFLVRWALRSLHGNGGFDNAWVPGASRWGWSAKVYGVATSNTALAMMLYARLVDNPEFAEAAENAALLLVKDWNDDGRNINWVFEAGYPGYNTPQDPMEFGDTFYILECMSGIMRLTRNRDVKARIFEALRKHILGSDGLLKHLGDRSWWPIINAWNASKSVAVPIAIRDFLAFADEFKVPSGDVARAENACQTLERFILSPPCARQLGAMLDDPDSALPFLPHGCESWTNFSFAATGFAGIAYADIISRSALFPGAETYGY